MPDIDEDSENTPQSKLRISRMSGHSMTWDNKNKEFLTESERYAKEADKDGKGYLDQEAARFLGTKITDLRQANTKIRRILWFFVMLVILLCAATIAATYFAIRASKDTVVNEFGRLEATDGSGDVAVKAQGIKIFTYNVQGSTTSTDGDADGNVKEHVRSLREGTWNQRNLKKKPKKTPKPTNKPTNPPTDVTTGGEV
jgi:hypothetical protein